MLFLDTLLFQGLDYDVFSAEQQEVPGGHTLNSPMHSSLVDITLYQLNCSYFHIDQVKYKVVIKMNVCMLPWRSITAVF